MNYKLPFIVGYVTLQSDLTLEEIAQTLSVKIFGGIKFGGRDLEIHEEIPAVFIESPILGLKIVLEGNNNSDKYYSLSVGPWVAFPDFEREEVRLDNYLVELLKIALKEVKEVRIVGK